READGLVHPALVRRHVFVMLVITKAYKIGQGIGDVVPPVEVAAAEHGGKIPLFAFQPDRGDLPEALDLVHGKVAEELLHPFLELADLYPIERKFFQINPEDDRSFFLESGTPFPAGEGKL